MRTSIALIAVCLIASGCRRANKGAPMFSPTDGVTHERKAGLDVHTFHWGDGDDTAVFMISRHPAGLSESMVRGMAAQTAERFEPELKGMVEVQSVAKRSSDISVGRFSGKQIEFLVTTKDGQTFHQCMYVLWDGQRVWQGQLTGSTDGDIAMVHRILASRTD